MSIAGEAVKELLGMFLADARLTAATLFLVAIVGGLVGMRVGPIVAGGTLLFGCLAIVAATAAIRAGRRGQQ